METNDLSSVRWPVSYATRRRKAVALQPGQKSVISDFFRFGGDRAPEGRTEVWLWHDQVELWLEISCHEPDPAAIIDCNHNDAMSLWQGDLIEIFFGAIEPVPWQLQLAVGAGGGRFDSSGRYAAWSAVVSRTASGWQAEVRIPLSFLRLADLGCGFNVCRQSLGRGELSSWSRLERAFHEIENYGQLYFCGYNEAYFARFSEPALEALTRRRFEQVLNQQRIEAHALAHGPWLSNPLPTGMTISWTTAGLVAAELDYRAVGARRWRRLPVALRNGILAGNERIHTIDLTGLKPGHEYEYRLINWGSLQKTRRVEPAEGAWRFRTLDPAQPAITFAACADVHSNARRLEQLMHLPEVTGADFFVNLGDMLSHMSGQDAFFDGFLDVQVESFARTKPLVFVRGNHEQIGLFAAEYFRVMHHPGGRTFYAFRHGPVCFIALDAGNDHPDDVVRRNVVLLAEERCWLEELIGSELFLGACWRVALLHIPPCRDTYDAAAALALVGDLFSAVAPLHLLLSGHLHRYFCMPANSGVCLDAGGQVWRRDAPQLPFTVVANSTDTVLVVQATGQTLEVRLVDATGHVRDCVCVDGTTAGDCGAVG